MGKYKKQLEAVIATREFVEEKAKQNDYHSWYSGNCPLCKVFDTNPSNSCNGCPFSQWALGDYGGCVDFTAMYFEDVNKTPIEYILSFLIDLEDCYRRMER